MRHYLYYTSFLCVILSITKPPYLTSGGSVKEITLQQISDLTVVYIIAYQNKNNPIDRVVFAKGRYQSIDGDMKRPSRR